MPVTTEPPAVYQPAHYGDEVLTLGYRNGIAFVRCQTIENSTFLQVKDRVEEARRCLAKTARLGPDWHPYGAEPPNESARFEATRILHVLEAAALPPTRLTPSSEGGIALVFVEGVNRALIETYNTGEIAAVVYSDEGETVVWEIDANDLTAIEVAINRIRVHLAS